MIIVKMRTMQQGEQKKKRNVLLNNYGLRSSFKKIISDLIILKMHTSKKMEIGPIALNAIQLKQPVPFFFWPS